MWPSEPLIQDVRVPWVGPFVFQGSFFGHLVLVLGVGWSVEDTWYLGRQRVGTEHREAKQQGHGDIRWTVDQSKRAWRETPVRRTLHCGVCRVRVGWTAPCRGYCLPVFSAVAVGALGLGLCWELGVSGMSPKEDFANKGVWGG